jgi:hypothetical protein
MHNDLERQYVLEDSIVRLQKVNDKIATLLLEQEDLTKAIIAALGHEHAGERTYEHQKWKITCRTPNTYSLDTKVYKSGDIYLPSEFDPIKTSTTFTVDKKMFDHYIAIAPVNVRTLLNELVTIKPGKQSVIIKSLGA